MVNEKLIEQAKDSRKYAYVPYSKFQVGAALKTKSGKVYSGCNIENAAYPVSCCAERVAIFKAIAEGEVDFAELAVVGDTERPISPCGSCRQVMSEFFDPETPIFLSNMNGDIKSISMQDLLPYSFTSRDLNE